MSFFYVFYFICILVHTVMHCSLCKKKKSWIDTHTELAWRDAETGRAAAGGVVLLPSSDEDGRLGIYLNSMTLENGHHAMSSDDYKFADSRNYTCAVHKETFLQSVHKLTSNWQPWLQIQFKSVNSAQINYFPYLKNTDREIKK